VVIEENIIAIRKRVKGRFLTNSPTIATAANSLSPVGANLKFMISILQAFTQNRPISHCEALMRTKPSSNCTNKFINLLFCGISQMNVKRKPKVFSTNQTMMQLLHFPLTIQLESKTHTQSNKQKKFQ